MKPVRVSGESSSFVVGGIHERSAVPVALCTVTVTGRLVLPPGPVQVNVNVLVWVRGPVLWLPESGLLPDQAPPALQEVASLDDHVRVEALPELTVVGLATNETVGNGAGSTVTVTDWPALPPAPVQVKINVLVVVNEPTV